MRSFGASEQGAAHRLFQVPNQDAWRTAQTESRVMAAVCDGVSLTHDGNWSQSELAARYCADAFLQAMDGLESDTVSVARAFRETADGLLAWLGQEAILWIDCQCTLLAAVLEDSTLYAGLAGDGGILFERTDGTIGVLVTKPKTSAVVEPICLASGWRFAQVDHVKRVLLATDGIFDGLVRFDKDSPQADAGQVEAWLAASCQEELTALVRQAESHDDKTAVLVLAEASEQQPDTER